MMMSMKKNIVQDVIPPKKTIRNVELLYKSKRLEKNPEKNIIKPEIIRPTPPPPPPITPKPIPSTPAPVSKPVPPPPPPVSDFSYKYEYDESVRHSNSKRILYIVISLFVLALLFGISALFKSAEIRVTPKNETKTIDEDFKALKDVSANSLGFQVVTTAKDVEKTVEATGEEKVDTKATGTIVVYNNYSTQSQPLVKTTRFATTEGLIFRATEDVMVPGTQVKDGKTVAGSVEITVEADKPGANYNISFKDFTIPGFKGTPKYTKIYARSKTEMTGGFSGMQKTASKDVVAGTDKELEDSLKASLSKDIVAQIPENFILYQNTISYKLDPTTQVSVSSGGDNSINNVVLKKKGSISAIIFDKGSLSRAIISKILPDMVNDVIKITNLDDLSFSIASSTSFDPNNTTLLSFNLKGDASFVWVFDENKLKSDLLGLSKQNASTVISTYGTIKEAWIETHPFWNQSVPDDPKKVTLINTLTK